MVYAFHHKISVTSPYLGTLDRYFLENEEKVKYEVHKKPIPLVFDLTHDNETYASKKILNLQTPVAIVQTFLGTFIGSTKGFDQFYSKKILVTELEPLYSKDYKYVPVVENSEVSTCLITFKSKGKCFLSGSWDHWK